MGFVLVNFSRISVSKLFIETRNCYR